MQRKWVEWKHHYIFNCALHRKYSDKRVWFHTCSVIGMPYSLSTKLFSTSMVCPSLNTFSPWLPSGRSKTTVTEVSWEEFAEWTDCEYFSMFTCLCVYDYVCVHLHNSVHKNEQVLRERVWAVPGWAYPQVLAVLISTLTPLRPQKIGLIAFPTFNET